eukprot:2454060-Amphidinium_carterae.1
MAGLQMLGLCLTKSATGPRSQENSWRKPSAINTCHCFRTQLSDRFGAAVVQERFLHKVSLALASQNQQVCNNAATSAPASSVGLVARGRNKQLLVGLMQANIDRVTNQIRSDKSDQIRQIRSDQT